MGECGGESIHDTELYKLCRETLYFSVGVGSLVSIWFDIVAEFRFCGKKTDPVLADVQDFGFINHARNQFPKTKTVLLDPSTLW